MKDWVVLVAGAMGILFTATGLFVERDALRVLFVVLAVMALQYAAYRVWKAERQERGKLARVLEPRLEFEYQPGKIPFFEEREGAFPGTLSTRWIRVGVRNKGGTAVEQVSVVLEKCDPETSPAVHLEHAFLPQGVRAGTAESTGTLVPAGSRVIVNLATATTVGPGPTELILTYAALVSNALHDNAPEYRLRLRAQGQGAPPAFCSFVIRPDFIHRPGDSSPEQTAGKVEIP